MGVTFATWMVRLAGAYLLLSLLFALPFAGGLAGRIDPVARRGTWGFRVLVIPGAIALWPLLTVRLLRCGGMPREERNAHRERAR